MDNVTFYILFVLFLVLLIFIIVKGHKRQYDLTEYSVGGRSAGALVFTFSFAGRWFVGSIFTVWFVMAAERGVYAQYLIVYTIGALLMLYIFGVSINSLGKKFKLETQADFIQLRYGSTVFKGIFAGLTMLFWLPWVILELKTMGYAIAAASMGSMDYNISIIITTMIIIIYVYYGGVRSVNNASILQSGIVFVVGVVCSYIIIRNLFGGIGEMFSDITSFKPEYLEIDIGPGHKFEWLSATISGALGSILWPGMYALIYTAKSPGVIKRSAIYSFFLLIPPIFFILLLGMGAGLVTGDGLLNLTSLFTLAERYGSSVILSLFGIGTIAASMSMCSSVFNVAGMIIAKDLNPYYNNNKRDSAYKVAKVGTVVIGLIALWMATIQIPNLASIMFLMYSFITQTAGPIIIGIIWRRSNIYGAASGMAAGILTTAVITFTPEIAIFIDGLSAGIIGLFANIIVHILVSLITPPYEKVDEIFKYRYL